MHRNMFGTMLLHLPNFSILKTQWFMMTDSRPADWNPDLYTDKHAFVWQLADSLVDMLAPQAGERILDVGCGTGQLTATIAEAGAEVIGLDNSESMLSEARREFPHVTFDLKDAHNFSYDSPFDAVFSNAALHWVTDPVDVVRCIASVIRPGGRFVAEFGGHGNVRCLCRAARVASESVTGQPISHPWYFPGIANFSSLLETAGLEVTQAHLFDRPVPLEGESGLRDWLSMFGSHWLDKIPADQHADFFRLAENDARPDLFRDGRWHADYRRIRIVALKSEQLQ